MGGEKLNSNLGKFVRQSFTIVVFINTDFFLGNDRSGIHSLIHNHQGDAGLGVLILDRLADTEGAAVLGEKRKVEIEGANFGKGEPRLGDDFAVTDDEKEIGF